jgi:hypothetical protein
VSYMNFITPEDASQIARLIYSLRTGAAGPEALEKVTLKGQFARQVAGGLIGRKVPAGAKKAADELSILLEDS